MDNCEILIVGQGIAGSLIAGECIKREVPFRVIAKTELSLASRVAAGIINPITGRKFVKTWMYEALEHEFVPSYQFFEALLGGQYLISRDIIRAIPKVADQNNWDGRSISKEASPFMHSDVDFSDFEEVVHKKLSYGRVNGYQLRIADLVNDFRAYLLEKDLLTDEFFEYSDLQVDKDSLQYKNFRANHIVFCEGHLVSNNPYFKDLPFSPAKGELLLVKIPRLKTEMLLKDQVFIAPLYNDLYWVGATYAWDHFDDSSTEEKYEWLKTALEKVVKVDYEIIAHRAGVRPATKFRRPLLGTHKNHPHIHLFNGLGTKGSSLGPYWAKHFMNYLLDAAELSSEVDCSKKAL